MNKSEHIRIIREHLDNAKKSDLILKIKVISDKCCSECDKVNGSIISLEESDTKPPIPHTACTRENGCNCIISFVPQRNEKGKLILKSDLQ